MSIVVRTDYFQGTCYFADHSEWIACLGLFVDLLSTGDSRALRHKSLFSNETCDYWVKSIKSILYGVFRLKLKE